MLYFTHRRRNVLLRCEPVMCRWRFALGSARRSLRGASCIQLPTVKVEHLFPENIHLSIKTANEITVSIMLYKEKCLPVG